MPFLALESCSANALTGSASRFWSAIIRPAPPRIEYRLFSQITRNWAGKPLRSFATMRNYIRSTTTTTGLTVKAFLVDRAFQKGRKLPKSNAKQSN